jgi:hypothetical protein
MLMYLRSTKGRGRRLVFRGGGGGSDRGADGFFGQFFFGNPSRAERKEKVFRYVLHRITEDANLQEVLQEHYVRRNCSQDEIDEIHNNPELIYAAKEHLEQTFRSGELDPRRRH